MSRKRLLFLHTGGTLGMAPQGDPGPLAPSAYADNVLPFVRGLERLVDIQGTALCNIDSSDMTPTHWESMAAVVAEHLDAYDGFVVLHGTDTMAYSASAMSLLLHNLPKPVVLTGSQRPIAELRTDARMNLIHAAICATLDVPEVGLYFGDHLFRGNRTTKTSVQSYDAYTSPALDPLVEMGMDVHFPIAARTPSGPFVLRRGFDPAVSVLTLFPGMDASQLDRQVEGGARAVILQAFGAGNVPLRDWPVAIERAVNAGVHVILATQCLYGGVELGRYEASAAALKSGALGAGQLTLEACLTKAMFLLAQPVDFRDAWTRDWAGEGAGQANALA